MKQIGFTFVLFLIVIGKTYSQGNKIIVINNTNVSDYAYSFMDYYWDMSIGRKKETKIKSDQPVLLFFTTSFAFYPIYVFPSDSIAVQMDKNKGLIFSGTRSIDELNFLVSLEKKYPFTTGDVGNIDITNRLNLNYIILLSDSIFSCRVAMLEKFADSLRFSEFYKQRIYQEMNYIRLSGLLKPFYKIYPDFDYSKIPQHYIDRLLLIKNELNDSLIDSRNYRILLLNYNKFLRWNDNKDKDLFSFASQYTSARNNFTGKTRDFLLFLLIKQNIDKGLYDFDSYLTDFNGICQNTRYIEYMDSVKQRYEFSLTKFYKSSLQIQDGSYVQLGDVLAEHLGKVIYLDFWASWCGPCIQEMPNSKKLSTSLKDSNVEFIYISIDDDEEAWKKGYQKLPSEVRAQEHYRISSDSELAKFFIVPPIPKYVILNKKGGISAFDATRPGDPVTNISIKRLIGE